jgi:predicted permease
VRLWSTAESRVAPATWFEFSEWRAALTTFDALGAVRTASFNIDADGALGEPVAGARVTASTFDVLGLAPLLGRTLHPEDEGIGAPHVVVLGYDVWRARFGGDPAVVGRTIRIGGVAHTVVGVMPRGFRFPVAHQVWLPLRERAVSAPGGGLPLVVLGRLGQGVSTQDVQRQVEAVGVRLARGFPTTYEHLHPEVVHAAYLMFNIAGGTVRSLPELRFAQALTLLMLLVACTNVALLTYARMAARSGEIAVRSALGASRGRIIGQIFTECLVMAVLAAGAGLLLIDGLPRVLPARVLRLVPWWVDLGVTARTVAWALALAAVSAAAAGVVPALRLTGRSVQRTIQRARAQRSGVRFGGMTTALVAADVAIAIAIVGSAMAVSDYLRDAWNGQKASVGFAADRYLAARLRLSWQGTPQSPVASERVTFAARLGDVQGRLVERLAAEPDVSGVAIGDVLPRMQHPTHTFELDDEPAGESGHRVKVAHVDAGFFAAFDKPILAGRGFDANDARDGSAVIVNTAFVSEVLDGRNPVGRRVRSVPRDGEAPGPWLEIVGVVGPLGMDIMAAREKAGLYHPLAPGAAQPWIAVRVNGDPATFAPRLRAIAAEVDASVVITDVVPLAAVFEGDWYFVGAIMLGGVLLIGVLVALAGSAIYAMVSFSVARRTREMGIRAALGANRGSIVVTVTRRTAFQLGLGLLCGAPLAIVLFTGMSEGRQRPADLLVLVPGILAVLAVGALACAAPARRALRISPTEALREE